jgi:hypothetical protein
MLRHQVVLVPSKFGPAVSFPSERTFPAVSVLSQVVPVVEFQFEKRSPGLSAIVFPVAGMGCRAQSWQQAVRQGLSG